MDDLISRQAAITAIQNAYCDTEGGEDKCAVWKNVGLTEALHIMQDLPSAQPEIIRCKDCKYWNPTHRYCEGIGNWFGEVDSWSDNGFCFKGERRTDGTNDE